MTTSHPIKARLTTEDGEAIEFMFNPTEIEFSRSLELKSSEGARTSGGLPKVSFAYPNPYTVSIGNILFDTYESGKSVLDSYINKFRKGVEFIGSEERPPIYLLTWGDQEYLRCFIKSLRYKLALFLPDGTPVRAIVDLTLEEIDSSAPSGRLNTPNASSSRATDTRARRRN